MTEIWDVPPLETDSERWDRINAVLIAKSAILNAEVAAMQAANTERVMMENTVAYDEIAFYQAADDLMATLATLEKDNA